jgi:hypothetical protein
MDAFKKTGGTQTDYIPRIFGHVKAHPNMALGGQIVYFIRFDVVDQMGKLPGIGKVSVMQEKPYATDMRVGIDMIYSAGIEGAGAADQSVNFIPFGQEQFSKIGTVLSGNTRNKSSLQEFPPRPDPRSARARADRRLVINTGKNL